MISTSYETGVAISPRRGASLLRQELTDRNHAYATLQHLPHITSYGETPIVVYRPSECGRLHGNFIAASYRAILRKPEWKQRLQKVHTSGKYAFPRHEQILRELDSSMSSDALLMNIFCYPRVSSGREVRTLLGTGIADVPQFGYRPRIALPGGIDRTEIDMKLGTVLFEAKLTEGDFQIQDAEIVEQYGNLKEVFECGLLPRIKRRYVSYQLIRNILAAHALDANFCLLIDARRPDLLESWYQILRCVRSATLRTRCRVTTWQELSFCLPPSLKRFLDLKYGVRPGIENG